MICNNVLMTFNSFPTFSKNPFRLSVIRLVLFIVFRYYLPWLCSQCIAKYFSMMRPWFPEIAENVPSRFTDGPIYISEGFQKSLRGAYGTLTGRWWAVDQWTVSISWTGENIIRFERQSLNNGFRGSFNAKVLFNAQWRSIVVLYHVFHVCFIKCPKMFP